MVKVDLYTSEDRNRAKNKVMMWHLIRFALAITIPVPLHIEEGWPLWLAILTGVAILLLLYPKRTYRAAKGIYRSFNKK